MLSGEVRSPLADAPMHRLQIGVIALCIALNALDGFDVLAISFAAPGIAAEWGIDRAVLGVVLSAELVGMALGSVLIGALADRIGRRPTIIGCLVLMAAGMGASGFATGVALLAAARTMTGVGIGGMLSATSATVAEFANDRRRGLAVVLNIAGYSTGAILGGLVATHLLASSGDWRSVFLFGSVATLVMLPVAVVLLPESIASLVARRPAGALEQVNATLARLGHPPLAALPPQSARTPRPSFAALLAGEYRRITVALTVAYFFQIMLFYFIQKWVPKIVVDLGYDAATGARVLVWANVGNLVGALSIGLATQRWPLRPLVAGAMVAGFVAIVAFGWAAGSPAYLAAGAAIAAFFINAGVVGLYPVLASAYPASLRAGGTGFVIGVGRGGSAAGPVIAGLLFANGAGLGIVSVVMGVGALVAAAMLLLPHEAVAARRAG